LGRLRPRFPGALRPGVLGRSTQHPSSAFAPLDKLGAQAQARGEGGAWHWRLCQSPTSEIGREHERSPYLPPCGGVSRRCAKKRIRHAAGMTKGERTPGRCGAAGTRPESDFSILAERRARRARKEARLSARNRKRGATKRLPL